ncbi:DNA-binding protein [Phenylobacterium ferrooxidans]|uniref:DNA-binding protein n=1 Tax=Phenylobacterium ferrooxidans TaxID=2982689 RepID=A0ABW6CJ82_9CAUL
MALPALKEVAALGGDPPARAATYLTPQEVSERWDGRITPKTLANWRCDEVGKGPRFKRFGNRILYPVADLETWEEENSYGTTKDYGKKDR